MGSAESEKIVESEAKPSPSVPPALPPPASQAPISGASKPGAFDRLISFVEMRPVWSTSIIFALLLIIHVVVSNAAGAMDGVFVGPSAFFLSVAGLADVLLLGLISYCIVLPTFLARACLTSFADAAPALTCNDHDYDTALNTFASSNVVVRLVFGGFWAAVLTSVFGSLLQGTIPQAAANPALLTFWMYVRLAMAFGMVGSSLAYAAVLHYRLSGVLNQHLRIDLFDGSAQAPLAKYMRRVVLIMSIPVLLLGPIVSRPEAATASGTLLAFVTAAVLVMAFGSMWGARSSIRRAKQAAQTELQAYAREIWRRAYANGRIVEAVALPALASMVTIRNQLTWMSNWPGGWVNVVKCGLIALLPAVSWFGPQLLTIATSPFLN